MTNPRPVITVADTATADRPAVALIGCGPGDPGLLTLKALDRIRNADVLVTDRLVNPALLNHARPDARRVFVGKSPGGPSVAQGEIDALIVSEARAGRRVARLKGGDPLVFGRAVEEMSALQTAGIAFEIVPGITAAQACAASIRLPVTSRGLHRKFSILAGAAADGDPDHDWRALAASGEAFAIYMGVRTAPAIRYRLLAAGISPATPVAIVENGTLPQERAFATTIGDVVVCMHEHAIDAPAVIFVGLDWSAAGLEMPPHVRRFSIGNVVPFSTADASAARRPGPRRRRAVR